jgi:hypothetical protein
MSDKFEAEVLHTEHAGLLLAEMPGLASLWSYETRTRERDRQSVTRNPDGSHDLRDRSDPLLNTILPGMGVSLVVNFGDLWACGRSLATSEFLSRVSVVGPVTQARISASADLSARSAPVFRRR